MAEFGSFGKGLAISREIRQTAEINKFKAETERADKQADNARLLGEQIRDNMKFSIENAVTVAEQMNAGLVAQAKLGEIDPQMVAEVKRNQLLALANVGTMLDQARMAAASDPNIDPNVLAAMPSGTDFLRNQEAALQAQVVEAMADSPIPRSKAEALAMLTKTAVVLGYDDPSQLPPEIRAKVVGTTIDPKLKTFYKRDGGYETVDYSLPEGQARGRQLIAGGAIETPVSVETNDPSSLTKREFGEFRQLQATTMDMLDQIDRIRTIIDTDKPIATGLTRDVAGFLTEAASQMAQAREVLGFEIESDLLGPNGDLNFGNLDYSAIEDAGLRDTVARSETLRFALGALAFMRARVFDPNDRLSGQEVQFQLNEIGRGKLTTLQAILNEIELETVNRFGNRMEIFQTDPLFDTEKNLTPTMKERLDRAAAAMNPETETQTEKPAAEPAAEPETKVDTKAVQSLTTYVSGFDDINAGLSDPEAVKRFKALSVEDQKAFLEELRKKGLL